MKCDRCGVRPASTREVIGHMAYDFCAPCRYEDADEVKLFIGRRYDVERHRLINGAQMNALSLILDLVEGDPEIVVIRATALHRGSFEWTWCATGL